MNPYARQAVSVSDINSYAKSLLENDLLLSDILVKGEISNFVNHRTGHYYFSLKDETSAIKAVMFRMNAAKLPFVPENGMKVIVHGRVSLFERDGAYQLYADAMQPDGTGSLYYAYEQLRRKLEEKGMFSDEHKKPLPKMPSRIGIITSPTGAAIHDMTRIIGRRYPVAEIVLYPSLVQGDGAPRDLCLGIEYFNTAQSVDVIIIGRGGGSIEDLWAFNDEKLAEAVFASEIPVISAVGHESDFTICDFVADVRASTPSAAAELAVPDRRELEAIFSMYADRINMLLEAKIREKRKRLELLSASPALRSPTGAIDTKRLIVASKSDKLDAAFDRIFHEKKVAFGKRTASLEAMSPLAVLSRGYVVSYDESGNVIKSVRQIKKGDNVRNELADGSFYSTVGEIVLRKDK